MRFLFIVCPEKGGIVALPADGSEMRRGSKWEGGRGDPLHVPSPGVPAEGAKAAGRDN